ncbi:MAG: rod-binding protein [Planctomycetota bacterium]
MLSPVSSPSLLTSAEAKLPAALSPLGRETNDSDAVHQARELKAAFQQFVGETFFGQLMKSMRETVNEPAYLHGGMAEEQFQARLDQQIAQDMAATGSDNLAENLFASQFPAEAELLATTPSEEASPLKALDALRRR